MNTDQRKLHNPAAHLVINHYYPPTTSEHTPSARVDAYIKQLVQDQLQLALIHCSLQDYPPADKYAGYLQRFLKSLTISRMLTFCLIVWSLSSLVRYVWLSDKGLPTRQAAMPVPFFSNTSSLLLEDHFWGQGADKSLLVANSELTILMFYAPWSLHSMEARQPFLEVAAAFKDISDKTIKFVAINCNDHRGQCRSIYKLYYFPVIFGYVMGGLPIVFNEPLTADHLFSWVSHLLMPDTQIKSSTDLNQFTKLFDYSVVGYLPLERGVPSRAFQVFLISAYKSAAARAVTGFASFQSALLGEELGLGENANQLQLYTSLSGNQPSLLSFLHLQPTTKSEDVLRWMKHHMHSPTVDILNFQEEELGGKSEMLFRKLNSTSATVLLFSEQYGLPYFTEAHNTLRQMVKTFHNCEASNQHTAPSISTPSMNSLQDYLKEATLACLLQHTKQEKMEECCASLRNKHHCSRARKESNQGEYLPACFLVNQVVDQELFRRKCCSYHASNRRSNSQNFQFSLPWKAKHSCRFLRLMRKTRPFLREQTAIAQNDSSTSNIVKGLHCNTNITLGFLLMDKRLANYFIGKWGGSSSDAEDRLAIISNSDEKIYWMEGKVNKTNVEVFLHEYITGGMEKQPALNNMPPGSGLAAHNFTAPSESTITWLNSSSFTEHIAKERNSFDSLVFLSGGRKWHGPSQVLSYILHCTKHYFHQFHSLIHFYCLDASKESLPWQYTFDSLPALVFFPAYRPNESSVFPRNLPLTIPNLMAFLLSRVQPELRFRLAVSSCTSQCLQNNQLQVSQFLDNLQQDMQSLRRLLRSSQHSPLIKSQFRVILRRRFVQKRAAGHLRKVLELLQPNNRKEKTVEESLVRDSIFVHWLVTNPGLTFKS